MTRQATPKVIGVLGQGGPQGPAVGAVIITPSPRSKSVTEQQAEFERIRQARFGHVVNEPSHHQSSATYSQADVGSRLTRKLSSVIEKSSSHTLKTNQAHSPSRMHRRRPQALRLATDTQRLN